MANIIPKDVKAMLNAFDKGDLKIAREMNKKMFPLIKAMFIETNPIPVKAAMVMLGMIADELRLPMTSLEEANKVKLAKVMKEYGLKV